MLVLLIILGYVLLGLVTGRALVVIVYHGALPPINRRDYTGENALTAVLLGIFFWPVVPLVAAGWAAWHLVTRPTRAVRLERRREARQRELAELEAEDELARQRELR